MEKNINQLSVCYMLFLILLFVSGAITGIASNVIYFLAFLIPFAVGIKATRENETTKDKYLAIKEKDFKFFVPLVFPTISLIIIVSALTSFLIYLLTGAENNTDVGDSFVIALFSHALLPAFLEEALFRYLPLRLLSPYSKRVTVLISALFFALIHHSLFSIPYAFIAGLAFMAIDIVCDSIVPSVIIHFINNALSVGLLIFKDNTAFASVAFVLIAIFTIISLIFIAFNRKKYIERFTSAFERGEKFVITSPMVSFVAICLVIAIVGLMR